MIKKFDDFINKTIVDKREKTFNAWFNSLEFKEMEKIFRVRQSDFNPEDGYQEFVDYCDEQWDKLSFEEKEDIYKEYSGKPSIDEKKLLNEIFDELQNVTEREYAQQIADNIVNDVTIDIDESAEIENYNSSDVRLAIGRVLVKLTTPENRN